MLHANVRTRKGNEEFIPLFAVQNYVFVNGSLFTRHVGILLSDELGYWKLAFNSTLIKWKNKKNQVRL